MVKYFFSTDAFFLAGGGGHLTSESPYIQVNMAYSFTERCRDSSL